jgi:hypothetical protein
VSASSAALLLQVEYQLEFAEWLLVSGTEPGSKEHTAEALLLTAVATLTQLEEAAAEGALVQRASYLYAALHMRHGHATVTQTGSWTYARNCTRLYWPSFCLIMMHLGCHTALQNKAAQHLATVMMQRQWSQMPKPPAQHTAKYVAARAAAPGGAQGHQAALSAAPHLAAKPAPVA